MSGWRESVLTSTEIRAAPRCASGVPSPNSRSSTERSKRPVDTDPLQYEFSVTDESRYMARRSREPSKLC